MTVRPANMGDTYTFLARSSQDTLGTVQTSVSLGFGLDRRCTQPGGRQPPRRGDGRDEPPDVNLSTPRITAPGNRAQCVNAAGTYAASSEVTVGLEWAPDPAAQQVTSSTGSWQVHYEVQIRNVSQGASCPASPQALSDPQGCIWMSSNQPQTAVNLPAGTDFQWRVRSALMAAGGTWPYVLPASYGNWASWHSFKTAPPPTPPALVAPANNFTTQPGSPVLLRWQDDGGPNGGYEVEVLHSAGRGAPQPYQHFQTTQTSTSATLVSLGNYHWRVRTNTVAAPGGFTEWSPARRIRGTD